MIGKLPPDALSRALSRTGADDDAVLTGPAYGEDAAAIDLDGTVLVASSDPISMAVDRLGTLGVHVACNDVAASGADPRWLTVVLFLHDDRDATLDAITEQLDAAARGVGAAIVGGHTEYAPDRERPLCCLTALGTADRFVPTGGADPGDRVLLTKGAGIEGTAILATDFRDALDGVSPTILDRAAGFYDDISVVPDAAAVRAHATAMHDPTEGGVVDGLLELARASGTALDVDRDAVPVREETAAVCGAMGVDPLRIFGSGALVAAVPPDAVDAARAALDDAEIDAAVVGEVRESDAPELRLGDETFREPVRDDLYALWE